MKQKHVKKGLGKKGMKQLPEGKVLVIGDKDESLLNELKRIKKLQRGLYKEYDADELDEIED